MFRFFCGALVALSVLGRSSAVEDAAPFLPAEPWLLTTPRVSGDWSGVRPLIEDRGVSISGSYSAEVWGNTSGGLGTGTVYTGLLDFGVDVDLERAFGWEGASLSTTWLWLSGRDLSEDYVGNFLTVSNLAGFNTLRMLELWFQQELWDGLVSIRAGQLDADTEFMLSDYAALFLNGTFGWPAVAYMNLPEGGPGYPMGTLGARFAAHPTEYLSILAAAFQGNVFAQDVNRHGFRYRLSAETGYTFLMETQWDWCQEDTGLPGALKIGGWAQSGKLADALSESTGSGNYGFYGILDQMLFREPAESLPPGSGKSRPTAGKSAVETESGHVSDQGLGFFAMLAFTDPDRNFVSFSVDAGLTYRGLIPTREEDTLGVAFGYAQLSAGAEGSLSEEGTPPAGAEMVLECTYQAKVTGWLVVQPDVQYIIQPGGTVSVPNAFVIGARATVTF